MQRVAAPASPSLPSASARPESAAALFGAFFAIGMSGFGGVLPWARRVIVEQRRWLTPAEFTDLLALCQFLPGPNVGNFAIAFGSRTHGALGAISCMAGLLAVPMIIVIALGGVYARFGELPPVRHAFAALAAAGSGLILATAFKISAPLRERPIGIAVASATFLAVAVARLPLLLTLAVLAPVSIFIAWRFELR